MFAQLRLFIVKCASLTFKVSHLSNINIISTENSERLVTLKWLAVRCVLIWRQKKKKLRGKGLHHLKWRGYWNGLACSEM